MAGVKVNAPDVDERLVPPRRQSVEAEQHAGTDQHRAEPVAADLVGDVQRDHTDDRGGEPGEEHGEPDRLHRGPP